jgi:hypothetical protein
MNRLIITLNLILIGLVALFSLYQFTKVKVKVNECVLTEHGIMQVTKVGKHSFTVKGTFQSRVSGQLLLMNLHLPIIKSDCVTISVDKLPKINT